MLAFDRGGRQRVLAPDCRKCTQFLRKPLTHKVIKALQRTDVVDRRAFEKLVGYAAHPVHTEIPTANMQLTLENVEKKPLSPDLFEIPAGYEEDSKLATH